MNGENNGWKSYRAIARNVGGFILACALCFGIAMVLIQSHIENVVEEAAHWKDIEADVRMKSFMGKLNEICIVNMNDWTWPLAELRINGKYKLKGSDWTPGERRCFGPSEFKHWKHRWQFRGSRDDVETFTITIKAKRWPNDTIGVWVGGWGSK